MSEWTMMTGEKNWKSAYFLGDDRTDNKGGSVFNHGFEKVFFTQKEKACC
jgi:hypothetical protein